MLRQFELVEKVAKYDPSTDENLLNKAYVYSLKMHGAQKRASGDPYFSHPVEVAGILADFRFDYITITAALLHDTVEDTIATIEDIHREFGPVVAEIVDGVTKLSKLKMRSENNQQAENFRKLVVAMANDIRVLFLKLADRLHNMQTINYIKNVEKRQKIAKETLDIYAPLASRVGLRQMKDTLEDLSFKEINPQAYETTHNRLKYLCDSSEQSIEEIGENLKNLLNKGGVKAKICWRIKTPYSIWKKMITRNATFEQLCDILAFRIVVNTLQECYQAIGILHSSFWVVPGRFKDYISTPKVNNYQSIHTAIISPTHQRIEIQIRTEEMDLAAEYGLAAHWQYKQDLHSHEGKQYQLIKNLLQLLEQASNPEEFFENTKFEMFQDQVFCFTEKGELMSLPQGVTPIDFAYAVDSWLGDHLSGVKINGKSMPLKTVLQNGDQIEIITSEHNTIVPSWENLVCTGRARARIRQYIKSQQQKQLSKTGKEKLEKYLESKNLKLEQISKEVIKALDCESLEEVFELVGDNSLPMNEIELALKTN